MRVAEDVDMEGKDAILGHMRIWKERRIYWHMRIWRERRIYWHEHMRIWRERRIYWGTWAHEIWREGGREYIEASTSKDHK